MTFNQNNYFKIEGLKIRAIEIITSNLNGKLQEKDQLDLNLVEEQITKLIIFMNQTQKTSDQKN